MCETLEYSETQFSRKMANDDELTGLGVAVICIFIIFNALGLLGGFYAQVFI